MGCGGSTAPRSVAFTKDPHRLSAFRSPVQRWGYPKALAAAARASGCLRSSELFLAYEASDKSRCRRTGHALDWCVAALARARVRRSRRRCPMRRAARHSRFTSTGRTRRCHARSSTTFRWAVSGLKAPIGTTGSSSSAPQTPGAPQRRRCTAAPAARQAPACREPNSSRLPRDRCQSRTAATGRLRRRPAKVLHSRSSASPPLHTWWHEGAPTPRTAQ